MKTKLPLDIQTLIELIYSREDNLIHQKIILCRSIELHRGYKQQIPEIAKLHKVVHAMFTQVQEHRGNHEQSIFRKYQNVDIQPHYKPILFGYISKIQRHVKYFSNKLHSIINVAYQSINMETSQYQLELRQFGLENINRQIKLGVFLKEFQLVITNRYKKQLNKFLGFYQSYAYLIDKRAQKCISSALKQERYKLLITQKSVQFSVKCFYYYLSILCHSCHKPFLSTIKGIKNLDLDENPTLMISNLHQSIKQDGFCQVYISKIQKITKQLFNRNSQIQKFFPKTKQKEREKDLIPPSQSRVGSKVHRQSFNSRRSVCESVNKNIRISNIQNIDKEKQKEKQKQKTHEKPNEKRLVLRQTLVQIVLGEKQIHSKYSQPHTSDVFLPAIKDKHMKNQAGNLYRRIYALKQST